VGSGVKGAREKWGNKKKKLDNRSGAGDNAEMTNAEALTWCRQHNATVEFREAEPFCSVRFFRQPYVQVRVSGFDTHVGRTFAGAVARMARIVRSA
jgi:hypothetical protein